MILACNHCVHGKKNIGRPFLMITSDGTLFKAKVFATNPINDLSLLHVENIPSELKSIEVNTMQLISKHNCEVEMPVFCIGNPHDWDLESNDLKPKSNGFWPFTLSSCTIDGYKPSRGD